MNKKSQQFLSGHVLNIILAVLVLIVIFGFLVVKVYGMYQDKSNLEKAKGSLNNFIMDFDNFIKGTETQKEFMITGPEGWYVLFYEKDYTLPKACEGYDYCACICDGDDSAECDKSGVCAQLKNKWQWRDEYKIDQIPYTIKVTKNG